MMLHSNYLIFIVLFILYINSLPVRLLAKAHSDGQPPQPQKSIETHHVGIDNQTEAKRSNGESETEPFKRVCYFRMDPKTEIRLYQVHGNLCTHIILAFARIDTVGNIVVGSKNDESYLAEVPEFKRKNPNVKVMISLYNEPEFDGFVKAAANEKNRECLAKSAIEFMRRYQLDGIDLDWEFPNFPTLVTNREQERSGLTAILDSLRLAFDKDFHERKTSQGQRNDQERKQLEKKRVQRDTNEQLHFTVEFTGLGAVSTQAYMASKPDLDQQVVEPYLLTMATAAQETIIKASYELDKVVSLCDWLNIMSYDYYLFKAYAPFTGPNSPLYSIFEPYIPFMGKLSHSSTVKNLLENHVPRGKIVMGIPTYARAYKLVFKQTEPETFSLATGEKGGRIDDYLDYREVCDILKHPDTVVGFDERARVPYLISDGGYTWISFENEQSVQEKVRHVIENNLGGYMTWNLNSDDFLGSTLCSTAAQTNTSHLSSSHSVTFPLHRTMRNEVITKRRRIGDNYPGNQSNSATKITTFNLLDQIFLLIVISLFLLRL